MVSRGDRWRLPQLDSARRLEGPCCYPAFCQSPMRLPSVSVKYHGDTPSLRRVSCRRPWRPPCFSTPTNAPSMSPTSSVMDGRDQRIGLAVQHATADEAGLGRDAVVARWARGYAGSRAHLRWRLDLPLEHVVVDVAGPAASSNGISKYTTRPLMSDLRFSCVIGVEPIIGIAHVPDLLGPQPMPWSVEATLRDAPRAHLAGTLAPWPTWWRRAPAAPKRRPTCPSPLSTRREGVPRGVEQRQPMARCRRHRGRRPRRVDPAPALPPRPVEPG